MIRFILNDDQWAIIDPYCLGKITDPGQTGRDPRLFMEAKSDKLAPKVLQAIEDGRSYRWIARDLGISKNTVTDIVRRHRQNAW